MYRNRDPSSPRSPSPPHPLFRLNSVQHPNTVVAILAVYVFCRGARECVCVVVRLARAHGGLLCVFGCVVALPGLIGRTVKPAFIATLVDPGVNGFRPYTLAMSEPKPPSQPACGKAGSASAWHSSRSPVTRAWIQRCCRRIGPASIESRIRWEAKPSSGSKIHQELDRRF